MRNLIIEINLKKCLKEKKNNLKKKILLNLIKKIKFCIFMMKKARNHIKFIVKMR